MIAARAQRVPLWEAPFPEVVQPTRTDHRLSRAIEDAIVEAFDRTRARGLTINAAFQQLEHDLAAMFEQLSLRDARELHRRLTAAAGDDVLCVRFHHLVADRRSRLLNFLAGAARRHAAPRVRR